MGYPVTYQRVVAAFLHAADGPAKLALAQYRARTVAPTLLREQPCPACLSGIR